MVISIRVRIQSLQRQNRGISDTDQILARDNPRIGMAAVRK